VLKIPAFGNTQNVSGQLKNKPGINKETIDG